MIRVADTHEISLMVARTAHAFPIHAVFVLPHVPATVQRAHLLPTFMSRNKKKISALFVIFFLWAGHHIQRVMENNRRE